MGPLLYLIAISHVSRFLFTPSKEEEKSKLRKLFLQTMKATWRGTIGDGGDGSGGGGSDGVSGAEIRTKKIAGDILHFRSFDPSSPNGLQLYSELPPERALLL